MFYFRTIQEEYPIKNTQIYQLSNGKYIVSFDTTDKTHEVFRGNREEILPKLAARVKCLLRIR